MRGVLPIELPPPNSGWLADRPIHKMPLDALISQPGTLDSFNTIVDLDGLLKPRLGYEIIYDFTQQVHDFQVAHALPVDPTQRRLMGAVSWTDRTGTVQLVVATMQQWFAFTGGAFTDITGTPNVSALRLPTRFAPFGVDPITKNDVVYGVNGRERDEMRRWDVSTAAYIDAVVPGANRLSHLRANDIAVVGNRLVAINTFDDVHGDQPQGIVWSDVLDGTVYHNLSFNILTDGNLGILLAIRNTSRTSAVIYAERGQWVITAQQGSNASAFRFDRLQSVQDGPVIGGPVTAAAAIDVIGQHYFVSTDRKVCTCDGQVTRSISDPIDSFLVSAFGLAMGPGSASPGIDPTTENLEDQRPVCLLDKSRGKLWFFVSFVGDKGESPHALCYDLRRGGIWEPPQAFRDGITMALSLIEQLGPTWDNPGIAAETVLVGNSIGFGISPTDTIIEIVDGTGFTANPGTDTDPIIRNGVPVAVSRDNGLAGVIQFGTGLADEMVGYQAMIHTSGKWVLLGCERGAFGTVAAAHAVGAPVVQYYTWETLPYASWDDIPAQFNPAMYLGTKDGLLLRFFQASTDRGLPIHWQATYAPFNPGPQNNIQISTIDLQLNPNPNALPRPQSDLFQVKLLGYRTPYDPAPVAIFTDLASSTEVSSWYKQLPKDAAQAANKPSNYLRFVLSGVASFNGPWLAEANFFGSIQLRPDRGSGYSP